MWAWTALIFTIAFRNTGAAAENHTLKQPHLRRLYHALHTPLYADSSWALADTLRLSFPDFRLTFCRGAMTALYDSAKTLTGLLFEGEANIDFRPRPAPEQFQLARFTGDSVFSSAASRLLLRMPEVSSLPLRNEAEARRLAALLRQPPALKSRNRREAEALQKTLDEGLRKRAGVNLAAQLLARRLGPSAEFVLCAFHAEFSPHFSPPLHIYNYNALSEEPLVFYSYFPKRIGRQFFTICNYAPEQDSAASAATAKVAKYNGWLELEENGRLRADLGVDLIAGPPWPPAMNFSLSDDLKVANVISEMGDTLSFVQEPDEAGVTVIMPAPASPDDTLRLLFQYEGEAMRRHDNSTFFLKNPIDWAPRLGYLERAHYDIVYKCPPRQRVLAVGELVREWQEAGRRLSFFRTAAPAKAATFCMGEFRTDTLLAARPGLPTIVMHTTSQRTSAERRRVAGDLANSLYFFGSFLGPYPQPCLRVVEAPTIHSQGFPGFVTLSWIGFTSHLQASSEALRGHEIAHQWFGNLAGWRTYHDQWLSESFAEYLGAMYVEWLAKTPGRFEQILQAWRDDVLERGHIGANLGMQQFGLGKAALRNAEGLKAGPIWMGARLGQNETVDYYTQIYEKGALVVHMLRWLLRDLETGSDARFWNLLADFIASHRHREPATGDFQRLAEKHYGAPLDWFFRQWIFQNQVPSYNWQYSIATVPAPSPVLPVARAPLPAVPAARVLRLSVQQENVPADFRMFIPVTLEFADGTQTSMRVLVTNAGGKLEALLPPAKLKRLVFNSGHGVLCRVKNANGERLPTPE